jgi:arylsulfatase A-like enzyme
VVHLAPLLADGRASALVLAERREVVARYTVRGPDTIAEDLGPWQLHDAALGNARRDDPGGAWVRVEDKRVSLVHKPGLKSAAFNLIELVGVFSSKGEALLRWENEGSALDKIALQLVTPAAARGSAAQVLRLPLAEHPGWTGTLGRVTLFPVYRGPQAFRIDELRLVREGFSIGDQPGPDGDGGLLAFQGNARRVWPTDDGVPLFATARVPRRGKLVVDTAVMGNLHGSRKRVTFAVDARDAGGGWQELARRGVVPRQDPTGARWTPLVADLAAWGGRDVELRLRAWSGEGSGSGGELRVARHLWGAPLVVGEMHEDRRPNVLLVTLDTLRADAVGCYGGPPVTPVIDALAARGLRFTDAWSACNSTLPAHTSILTGLDVPTHGVVDNRSTLARGVPTLAEAFRRAGYETAAAISVRHLAAGYSGLGRGFDRYHDMTPYANLDGAPTVEIVRGWLAEWERTGERPFFLWVHLFDPHTPYAPPADARARYDAALAARGEEVPPPRVEPPTMAPNHYNSEGEFLHEVNNLEHARYLYSASVAYADELVGQVLGELEADGLREDTIVALTSDHGESLGEHGVWYAHVSLFPQTVHVPLVLAVPGGPRGVVESRVSTAELAPTLAALLGLEGLASRGADLLATGSYAAGRRVYFVHSNMFQEGFRQDDAHYLRTGRGANEPLAGFSLDQGDQWLFDPAADPAALADLAGARPELAARYAAELAQWVERMSTGERVRVLTTAQDEAELSGMGYVGADGDGARDAGPGVSGPDGAPPADAEDGR